MNKVPMDDFLAHYGVKGMRWGKRKKAETSSRDSGASEKTSSSTSKAVTAEAKVSTPAAKKPPIETPKNAPKLTKQQAANLRSENEKFLAKSGFTESDLAAAQSSGGWKPTKKQIGIAILGAAAVGAAAYGIHKIGPVPEPGGPVSSLMFKGQVAESKLATWATKDYLHDSSYAREEFSLPVGHTFYRISKNAETAFSGPTYATSSKADYNRYISAFRQELGFGAKLNRVQFSAQQEIRVPKLDTVLDSLHTAMDKQLKDYGVHNMVYTREDVIDQYTRLAGGNWKTEVSDYLFAELKSKGYGAMVDDMDAGVIGETPLVVFGTEFMSGKSSTPIKGREIRDALGNLTEINNRKKAKE